MWFKSQNRENPCKTPFIWHVICLEWLQLIEAGQKRTLLFLLKPKLKVGLLLLFLLKSEEIKW